MKQHFLAVFLPLMLLILVTGNEHLRNCRTISTNSSSSSTQPELLDLKGEEGSGHNHPHINHLRLLQGQPDQLLTFAPQSGSFVYPSYLVISLTNPYDNIESVTLENEQNTVSAFILRKNSTLINSIIKGGPPGNYTIKVKLDNGTIIPSSSSYAIQTKVISVNPKEGSIIGGVIVEIECENCSPRLEENIVTIGTAKCKVISVSTKHLTCITEVDANNKPDLNSPLPVKISSGDYSSTSNDPEATFTFVTYDEVPLIKQIGSNSKGFVQQGETVVINGKNFEIAEETTVLRVGDFQIPISALNLTQLNFTVPFDMTPEKQMLTIHVGKRGATESQELNPAVKMISSQCLFDTGAYYANNQASNAYLYFDMDLTNYDPSYTFQVTFDETTTIEPKVTQSSLNKNYINVRVPYQVPTTSYSNLSAVTVNGANILETSIPLIPSNYAPLNSQQQDIIKEITFREVTIEQKFAINIVEQLDGLVITRLLLVNQDQSVEIQGSSPDGYPTWFYFDRPTSKASPYYFQGCSNQGTIYIQAQLPEYAYFQEVTTWELVDNPFPEGVITPGQRFTATFSDFVVSSNFLDLYCYGLHYPLFYVDIDTNQVNGFIFEIPPIFYSTDFKNVGDFGDTLPCNLSLRIGWAITNDNLVSRHIFEDNHLQQLSSIVQSCSMASKKIISVNYLHKDLIIITKYSKDTISYLGGEELILYGQNLKDTTVDKVTVKINGIVCSVVETTTTQIRCVTGFQQYIQLLDAPIVLVIQNGIRAQILPDPINVSLRLIDPIPFYGFLEFTNNAKVYIPRHNVIYMDDQDIFKDKTITYDRVLVDGSWVFEATMNYNLECNRILGLGGLTIGSESLPFVDFKFALSTKQSFDIQYLQTYGDLSGIISLPVSILKGQNSITLTSDIITGQRYKVGDKVLITGTTLGSKEESLTIQSLTSDTLTFTEALQYDHIVVSEDITMKDSTIYPFKVAPSLVKITKNIVLNLLNQNRDTYNNSPSMRNFTLNGAEFYFKQQQNQTTYRFTLNAATTIFDMDLYSQGHGRYFYTQFSFYLNKLDSCLLYDFNNAYQISSDQQVQTATNNIFIGRNVQLMNFFSILLNFTQNTFQNIKVLIQPQSNGNINLSRNIFYNTDTCLQFSTYYSYSPPPTVEDNKCFSTQTAISLSSEHTINASTKYSLVALDIRKTAINIVYYIGSTSQNYNPEYKQLRMVFKSALGDTATADNSPIAFTFSAGNYYNPVGLAKIEFIGFKGQIVSSTYQPAQNLLALKYIKHSFTSNQIMLNSDATLVIHDVDGSLNGNNKRSNISPNSLNFQSLSCTPVLNAASICQSYLSHVGGITFLKSKESTNQTFKLKRTNGNILTAPTVGFFLLSGEIYEGSLVDSNGVKLSFYTVSMMHDYIQESNSLGFIVNFLIKDSFIDYYVAQLSIYQTEQLADLQQNQIVAPQKTALSLDTCTHGQNSDQVTYIQVCFKQPNVPITLQFLFTPDVVPQNSTDPKSSRKFEDPKDWINGLGKTTQTDKRWTIQSNWDMVLSTGGVYEVPSLVIQGSLEISGSGSITINTKGIYIGAGQLKVSSSFTGKLTINFVITDKTEVIFRNPYVGGNDLYQGTFMIYNKFIIQNNDSTDSLQYRIKSVVDETRVLIDETTMLNVGDDVLISSPVYGTSLQTTVKSSKKTGSGILIEFNDPHGQAFKGYEKITISTSQYKLSPYVRILTKRIKIKNANIIAENYVLQYIPQIQVFGVQFENSSIILTHGISNLSIISCSFFDRSSNIGSSKDYYIFLDTLFNQYMDTMLYPTINIDKTAFYNRKQGLITNSLVWYNYQRTIEQMWNQMTITLVIQFTDNFLANFETSVSSPFTFKSFSGNIFVIASQQCLSTSACFAVNSNVFYKCGGIAIDMPNCPDLKPNIVALSGAVYSSPFVTSISDFVSIGNNKIQQNPLIITNTETLPVLKLTISNSYFVGDIDQIISETSACVPNKLISLFTDSNTSRLSVPEIYVSNSYFAYFKCSKIVQIPNSLYLSSLTFINSKCIRCSYNKLSDIFDVQSDISTSLLVQDIKSSFFSNILFMNPSTTKSTFITQIAQSPYIKQTSSTGLLSRLFVSQLKTTLDKQTFAVTEYSTTPSGTPTYNIQELSNSLGSILVLPLNKLYNFTCTTALEKNAFRLSSPDSTTKQYIQIKYKPKANNGLMIRNQYTALNPSADMDTSKGYDIMNLVSNDVSKITCGSYVYDTANDEYYIVITNEPGCMLRIFEYSTPKLSIVIPTPILPPPPPEQLNMCLAERQRLHIIEMLSVILNISKKQIRVMAQSNAGSCSLSRLLTEESPATISLTIILDSLANSSDDPAQSCLQQANCSANTQSISDNLKMIDNVQQNLQSKSIEMQFPILSAQTSAENLVNPCISYPYYLEGQCSPSCESTSSIQYYASSTNICMKCNVACKSCTAESEYGCTLNVTSSTLDCADGYQQFIDNSSSKKYCGKCPENCLSCSSSKCPTQACMQPFANQNGYCRTTCFSGYFNLNGVCVKCQANCANSCSSGTCECSTGYFFKASSTNPVCNSCPSLCATCSSEKNCLTCSDDKNEPKLLCLTEKYIEPAASTNSLPLILGLTLGIGMGAVVIGYIAKTFFVKMKIQKARVLEGTKYTETNILPTEHEPEHVKHFDMDIQQKQTKTGEDLDPVQI